MPNMRQRGHTSPLDDAFNAQGLLRHGAAKRALRCTPDFLDLLVRQGKLREVTITHGGRPHRGYPEGRVLEIAATLDAGVARMAL